MKLKFLVAKDVMTQRKILTLAVAAALATSTAGCDNTPTLQAMPEVNDENCKHENILKIEDKGTQQEFAGKCLRRGTFKPSPPRQW